MAAFTVMNYSGRNAVETDCPELPKPELEAEIVEEPAPMAYEVEPPKLEAEKIKEVEIQ